MGDTHIQHTSTCPAWLSGLRPPQRHAATLDARALIVLAGPGTGKTSVLTARVAHLIRERRVEPARILACTFSVRAAREMRSRLATANDFSAGDESSRGPLLPPHLATGRRGGVRVQTMHAFGQSIVRRFADRLGLPSRITLIDPAQRRRLTKTIVKELELFPHAMGEGIDALSERLERACDVLGERGVLPHQALAFAHARCDRAERDPAIADEHREASVLEARDFRDTAAAYEEMCARCWQRGWLTFADLLLLPIRLLSTDPNARTLIRSEWSHVLVDEFQDTNTGQIQLVAWLCGGQMADRPQATLGVPHICAVGDDDQAIYGFRGSDQHAFARFASLWPTHEVVELTENFRSVPAVVRCANQIIARASRRFRPDKLVAPVRPDDGTPVQIITHPKDHWEGSCIAILLRLARAEALARGRTLAWSDFAVLVRTHTDAERVASTLELEGIPWQRNREASPLADAGVDDLLAWLRWMQDPDSTINARRALTRPPILLNIQHALAWERLYVQQHRTYEVDPDRTAHPGKYPSFLSQQASRLTSSPEDVACAAALTRGLAMLDELRAATEAKPAAEALSLVMQRLDLAHAELLPGVERARRVRALITILSLAKDKHECLDEPGDLRAFVQYFDELRHADPKLASVVGARSLDDAEPDDHFETSSPLAPADPSARDDASSSGRVQILTAHAAKGLEFDTVFIPRVNPGHGYPKTSGGTDTLWTMPSGLIPEPEEIDPDQALLDEERRLFYVALTRAKRSVVLLGKGAPKSRSKSTNFLEELLIAPPPGVVLHHSLLADVHARATKAGIAVLSPEADDDSLEEHTREFSHRQSIDEVIAAAQRSARLTAAAALEHASSLASSEGVSAVAFDSVQSALADAARQTAALALAARNQSVPPWLLQENASLAALCERVRQGVSAREQSMSATSLTLHAPSPPLKLSYTSLDDYKRCPRCWYAKHVLRMPDKDTGEIVVGKAVHSALERFTKASAKAEAEGLRDRPALRELLNLGKDCLLAHATTRTTSLAQQLLQVQAQLTTYFERLHDPRAQTLEVEYSSSFPIVIDGMQHDMHYAIDRLDQMPDGSFRVVDFKTGKPWASLLDPKKDNLQLGIYAIALRHMQGLHDDEPLLGTAEFWCVMTGQRGVVAFADLKLERVRAAITQCVRGILAGSFERSPTSCSGQCALL